MSDHASVRMNDGDRVRITQHIMLHGAILRGYTGRIVDCGTRYATIEIETVACRVRVPIRVLQLVERTGCKE